ncbi:hypothetical protein QQZ08_000013 [Neonectria magnoliae]|uniref:Fungal N-terminal domain-containing protein n=1 Tax=Neonectria magnoliae TaxID=2732573 RepID=A0ABR1IJP9_9HYPO
MEPCSVAGTSIALAGTIAKLSTSLTIFIRDVREARAHIEAISLELNEVNDATKEMKVSTEALKQTTEAVKIDTSKILTAIAIPRRSPEILEHDRAMIHSEYLKDECASVDSTMVVADRSRSSSPLSKTE